MRRGRVYNKGRFAGTIEETEEGAFRFSYDAEYLADPDSDSISLTLPKQAEAFESPHLFSFFYGLLAEGANRRLQCRLLRIDENDHFGLLLQTARDTIGSVSVIPDEP